MKKYTISDIHGCPETLKALIEQINFTKEDELYFLGDYIDRGPDSKGVIDLIWQLQKEGHQVSCLRGNHEEMFLNAYDCLSGNDEIYHIETSNSFGATIRKTPQEYIDWLKNLPYYFEVDEFILVHAGIDFYADDPLEEKSAMAWARHWYNHIDKQWLGNRIIVHGHTPTEQSEIIGMLDNLEEIPAVNIDNGCVYDYPELGKLIAFELTERQLFFQDRVDKV